MILDFYFKNLTLQRKIEKKELSTYIKQGLPMTYQSNRKEAKQLMSEIRRDIRNRNSVSHFIKGLNVAQKDIEKFLIGSVEALVFGTFMVLFATITLLLVPVVPLN